MKKVLALILSIVLCVGFVGCVFDEAPTKEPGVDNSQTESKTENKEEIFGLNDSAVFETLKFTAIEIKESNGTTFFKPEADNVFVGVKFEIQNVSDEEQSISSLLLFDGYVDDVKCDYSISAACVFEDGNLDGSLAPGKKLVGWYPLEVPKNWQTIELDIKANWISNSFAKFVFSK